MNRILCCLFLLITCDPSSIKKLESKVRELDERVGSLEMKETLRESTPDGF